MRGTAPSKGLLLRMATAARSGLRMSVVPRAVQWPWIQPFAALMFSGDAGTMSSLRYSWRLSNAQMLNVSWGPSELRPASSAWLAPAIGFPVMDPLLSTMKNTDLANGAQLLGSGGEIEMMNGALVSAVGPLGDGCCTAAAVMLGLQTGILMR